MKAILEINIEKRDGMIIVDNPRNVNMLMGCAQAVSNAHLYNIKKKDRKYYIPLSEILKRLDQLKLRYVDLVDKINTITGILNSIDNNIQNKGESDNV